MRHVTLVSTRSQPIGNWLSLTFNQTTRYLCHDCNVNWLSQLEARASTMIGPRMEGKPQTLDHEACRLIAACVAKEVMVLEHVHASVALPIPRKHFDEFYANGSDWRPPSNTQVWLARHVGSDQPLDTNSSH
jgi:hypothetical protein